MNHHSSLRWRPSRNGARPLALCAAFLLAALALLGSDASPVAAQSLDDIDIPFEKFVLDNGLTVIVHEDRKAPIVAVNVWYHVGSKNEKPGKTGFAHLFEHLMFNGSENYNDDYFKVLEPLGATDLNGTTNWDRTNYFQNVPTSAVDVALWMESDRMGHLQGAVDQAKLDEQRGVVQNEKRQGENQPYGRVFNTLLTETYPPGHPYSWSVIGEMEDLDAASLEDVHEWFETYYGAANAVVVLAGDIDVETAREKAELYFGDIPSGPPVQTQDVWTVPRTLEHRIVQQDRVPQARVYKTWNIPEWGSDEAILLGLAADVMSDGKTSRLYKRLVYDDQISSSAAAFVFERELGSNFVMWADVLPGGDPAAVEQALDEELARLLAEGPTAAELARVQTNAIAGFTRGIERIGGFGGKSDVLAQNEVYGGDPGFYRTRLETMMAATPAEVHAAAQEWLSQGPLVLEVRPFQDGVVAESGADRSRVPEAGTPPVADFPDVERATLSNGLEVLFARRDAVPIVNMRLLVDAGYAADAQGVLGTASMALTMLDEGTETRDALQISEELQALGATLGTGSDLDASFVTMSALTAQLEGSLDLFADVILNPSFPQGDFERLKRQQLAAIQREKTQPVAMALRVMPKLIYGDDHAYSIPLTGSGTEESVAGMTRDDMIDFHDTWFHPNNSRLLVVGASSLDEMLPRLERAFGDWERGDAPAKNVASVDAGEGQAVYIMDRKDAIQSMIIAGHIAPPKANDDEVAIETMNSVLGGDFSARINMNLREDKHWSYGARSLMVDARGPRPFIVFAPVQTDKTKESVQEIVNELTGIVGANPATAAELDRAVRSQTLTLPGRWETNGAVLSSITEMVEYGLAEDHWDTLADRVRSLSLDDVNRAARDVVQPGKMIWVVVGDRAVIEPGLRELNLGPIYEIDADGNVKGQIISD